ncbi:MAG: hypothetical protein IH960_13545 [Chloroflexi bacterium]|nr:hypothetical protein [Chloroflexota bacterium]
MTKFIVIYYMPAAVVEQMQSMTPEQMQAGMEPWMKWAEECGDGLVDMGTPLSNGQNVSASGSTPSKREVTGFSILQAEDMAAAQAMLTGHPHFGYGEGCEIEVHESMPMSM